METFHKISFLEVPDSLPKNEPSHKLGFRLQKSGRSKRNGPAAPNLSAPVRVRSFDREFFEPDRTEIADRPTVPSMSGDLSSWIDLVK